MTQLTIDSTTGAALSGVLEPVELVDPSGRVLGTFRPAVDPGEYQDLQPPLKLAELRQRSATPGGYTTAEVLEHLERL